MKKVCVVTAIRAEYGLLKPLIIRLIKEEAYEINVVVTGTHLLEEFGYTIYEIQADGIPIACKIPIAHIHGGELTQGAVDDCVCHALTKMSYLHFASTQSYKKRIIQMGEDPDRVFHVGALGVENVRKETSEYHLHSHSEPPSRRLSYLIISDTRLWSVLPFVRRQCNIKSEQHLFELSYTIVKILVFFLESMIAFLCFANRFLKYHTVDLPLISSN